MPRASMAAVAMRFWDATPSVDVAEPYPPALAVEQGWHHVSAHAAVRRLCRHEQLPQRRSPEPVACALVAGQYRGVLMYGGLGGLGHSRRK